MKLKIFIQIIYKRQRLQKHRKLFNTENRQNNHRIYKIRRKKILIKREDIDHCKKKDDEKAQNILIISLNYC